MPVDNFYESQVDVVTSVDVYLDTLKLWHITSGLYFWEYFTTLGYEWKVFRGHLPYRWTIWVYSLARLAALLGVTLCLVIANVTTPVNCQLLIGFTAVFLCLSAASASLLIILRTIAIWNRNKVVLALTATIFTINIGCHLQSLIRLRSVWVPEYSACVVVKKDPSPLSFIPAMVSDMVLLLVVLIGLLVIRRRGGAQIGLTRLVWEQGVIWLVIGSAAEIPPLVLTLLHLNDPLHLMFEAPSVVIMTIAATRMHRSLVNSATSNMVHSSSQKSKWRNTQSTAPSDRVEVAVHHHSFRDTTGSTNDGDSSTITKPTWPPISCAITDSEFPRIPQTQSVAV